eukprot:TRINITY_DN11935_c0_g2_i1.p1 TRINITY_DN11935_c0_g2~~TRINITY_DN11935_c0_g2_i1.p1  ORF type:complete len:203 (+),score=26.77 TRINITY_DN11935_c0_g2_i1:108-716(+)
MAKKSEGLLKVCILGDGGVGKSSLMARFVNDTFDADSFHTIGVEFLNKELNIDGKSCHLQIWDTAGQERFRSLRTPFYRGSDCCMLVFDLTDRHSFDNISVWMEEFFNYADVEADQQPTFPILLIGNKVDVEGRQVSTEEAEEFCSKHNNLKYYETSAKTAVNVETAFYTVARMLVERQRDTTKMKYDTIDMSGEGKNGGCC